MNMRQIHPNDKNNHYVSLSPDLYDACCKWLPKPWITPLFEKTDCGTMWLYKPLLKPTTNLESILESLSEQHSKRTAVIVVKSILMYISIFLYVIFNGLDNETLTIATMFGVLVAHVTYLQLRLVCSNKELAIFTLLRLVDKL